MARRNLVLDPCVRCEGADCDMNCPRVESLDELLETLQTEGFGPHSDEVDERVARSTFSLCTNCGARGRFGYTGMKSEKSYRAFWTCRSCKHWIEV